MSDITLTITEEEPISLKIVEAALKPEQEKSVNPTYESQTVLPDAGCVLSAVHVGSIPDPTDEINITENGDYNVARIGTAHVDVPQGVFPTGTKEITANGTGIDVRTYESVDVNVPQGVFPTGTKEITENGTGIDVTNYAAVDVNVPGIVPVGTKQISITANGTTTHDVTEYTTAEIVTNVNTDPEKGIVFGDYDTDGYPHSVRFVGNWVSIPKNIFGVTSTGESQYLSRIAHIDVPEGVTSLEQAAFRTNNNYWTSISLPHTLTTIGSRAVGAQYVTQLTVPENVTKIGVDSLTDLRRCTKIILLGDIESVARYGFDFAGINVSEITFDFSHCTSVPPLENVNAFSANASKKFIIPQTLLATWQNTTNWVAIQNATWEGV